MLEIIFKMEAKQIIEIMITFLHKFTFFFFGVLILFCNQTSDEIPNYKSKRCLNTLFILYDQNENNRIKANETRQQELILLALLCRETVGKKEKERDKRSFSFDDLPFIKK